jgi:hypothetical protein
VSSSFQDTALQKLGIFPRSEFISSFLLNIVKNTRPMRKVKGKELEAYLFSFKLRSDGQLQVQCFSKKWHITENLERWNLGKINENKFSAHQT